MRCDDKCYWILSLDTVDSSRILYSLAYSTTCSYLFIEFELLSNWSLDQYIRRAFSPFFQSNKSSIDLFNQPKFSQSNTLGDNHYLPLPGEYSNLSSYPLSLCFKVPLYFERFECAYLKYWPYFILVENHGFSFGYSIPDHDSRPSLEPDLLHYSYYSCSHMTVL